MIIELSVIPKPQEGTRTVIESKAIPVFKGNDDCDYVCGFCNTVLAEKVSKGQIKNTVVCCPKCQQYNEFP